jgi:hypothetical protein
MTHSPGNTQSFPLVVLLTLVGAASNVFMVTNRWADLLPDS